MKKAPEGAFCCFGGAGGIRTRGGLLTHTRFPGVRLKPLIHRSVKPTIVAGPSAGFQVLLPTLTIFMAEAIKLETSVMLPGTMRVVDASAATLL